MYMGAMPPPSVKMALTKRVNLVSSTVAVAVERCRNLKQTCYMPFLGSHLKLREWYMMVRCFLPYFCEDYSRETGLVLSSIEHDNSKKQPTAPPPVNPVATDNPRQAHSFSPRPCRFHSFISEAV